MKREKILLSDFDIRLLKILFQEKTVNNILDELSIPYNKILLIHFDRLRNLKLIDENKEGSIRKIKISGKGIKLLEFLE